ncbi:endo-beta-N-acetylglucosaminidase family protein [Curtobacterium flaccumfaciens]|uniref:Endo-beta-N-acetylglucosaminidase family protein n=1 Tax=Curtobacterium poinsettiae TaxID=159612 RepID=A0A9Q9T4N0_9MICO|nr:endo-beta-N-acetylglucosaminidase H [Curtobacterium flaccumfaciens]UXN24270.1 endo-beta-N-acetylglucosaminidase family protein [Curtobacterium flaccumfaciens]UYC82388.1 endo-beta-N-acetylglucosaminidase family protein [Curtobacterium flaccumfaciens pv. poinsettiae]
MKKSTKFGIATALVAMLAAPLVPAAASAAPSSSGASHGQGTSHGGRHGHGHGHHAVPTKSGPTSIAYVEVNNDELANVGRYTLENGANAFDVAIIFAANINRDADGKAVLYANENVQRTLDQAATQIRPLQAKGIKVTLSVLGNHQGTGLANFTSKAAARDFAEQVSATVEKYGLDGVDLDDEYSDYGVDGTPQPNQQSIGWLISALRADMPGKIISFYDIGPSSDALKTANPSIGGKLDYAWNPYYGTYTAPTIPGLPKSKLSAAAVDIQNTPEATAVSLAQRTKADGYGVFMTYNLPGGDESAYVSSFTKVLYGQAASYR